MDILKKIRDSETADVSEMVCDLSRMFKNAKVLGRESASDSVQAFVDISKPTAYDILDQYIKQTKKETVFLKIGADITSIGINSTYIERTIYKYLKGLLIQNRTPNIMRYVFSFECNNVPEFKRTFPAPLIDRLEELSRYNNVSIDKLNMIVMEKGEGGQLEPLLRHRGFSDKEFLEIMIQVCYTLAELEIAGIRHNDLHPNNIWIDILPTPRRMIFEPFKGEYFVVNSRFLPKIYDFDKSVFVVAGAPKNTALEKDKWCQMIGVCENRNPAFDLLTVCTYLNQGFDKPKSIKTFINAVVRKPELMTPAWYNFIGRVCKKYGAKVYNTLVGGRPLTQQCDPNFVIPPEDVYTFEALWRRTTIFDAFKVSNLELSDYPNKTGPFPADAIPELVFETKYYVSQRLASTPIEVANEMYEKFSRLKALESARIPAPYGVPLPSNVPGARLPTRPPEPFGVRQPRIPKPQVPYLLPVVVPEPPPTVAELCPSKDIPDRLKLAKKSMVGSAFREASKLYGQTDDTFWMSKTDEILDGINTFIRRGVLQPVVPVARTEYRPGVIDDVTKLYHQHEKGVFQSFWCDVCASGEPNNTFDFSATNQPVLTKNPSTELRKEIIIGNNKYFITGTTPQYLQNHLRLAPEEHLSSYLFMLSKPRFKDIYNILYLHSPPNAKAIFDGNFGGEAGLYHAQLQLTDQDLSIVNESNKIIDQRCKTKGKPNGAFSITSPIVNAITLYHTSVDELYEEAANYFMLYFTPDFDRTKMYMSATLYVHLDKFVVTLFIGDSTKRNFLASDECPVSLIAPAYILNFGECLEGGELAIEKLRGAFLDPEQFKSARDRLDLKSAGSTEEGITKYFESLINSLPPDQVPTEAYQWQIFGMRDQRSLILTEGLCSSSEKYLTEVLQNAESCNFRKEDECPGNVFATYKMVLTIWIMCLVKNMPVPKQFDTLYLTPQILRAAIAGEIYNLTSTFRIQNLDSIVVKGRATSIIAQKTIDRLLKITSKSPGDVNMWIDYSFARAIPSSTEVIVPSKIKSPFNLPFVIKIAVPGTDVSKQYFIHESAVGSAINSFRKHIPNFIMTYGGIHCESPNSLSNLCAPSPLSASRDADYILMEHVRGITFFEYLQALRPGEGKDFELLSGIAQFALALGYAQHSKKFTGYNIHTKNIYITPNTFPKTYEYHIDRKSYDLVAPYTVVFTDYNVAHIDGMRSYPKDYERYANGQTTDQYNKTADVYSFLINVLVVLLVYNKSFITSSAPIRDLFARFQNVYGELFIDPLKIIVGKALQENWSTNKIETELTRNRKDRKHYLFVPEGYNNIYGPLELFEDIKAIASNRGRPSLFAPVDGLEVCHFGEYVGETGCGVDIPKRPIKQRSQIDKIRNR